MKSSKNIKFYEKNPKFTQLQLTFIKQGLDLKLDVSKYADPDFKVDQMIYILYGLKFKLNVDIYNKKEYTVETMSKIFKILKDKRYKHKKKYINQAILEN